MSDSAQTTPAPPNPAESNALAERVELYGILFTKFSQEGDGIWGRFNIMAAISLAGQTAWIYAYLEKRHAAAWQELAIGISVMGVVVMIWSLHVLCRLWMWHQRWRTMLYQLEAGFPDDVRWVRPHHELEAPLSFDPGMTGCDWKWWNCPGYTQPFLAAFLLLWVFFLALSLKG